MKIIIDLKQIKRLATKREDDNWEFRTFLKGYDMESRELDAIVHGITDEVMAQIDCTQCANCCKQMVPVLDKADISKFASGLHISTSEFQNQYLCQDDDSPSDHKFNAIPCPFLKKNQCSNYDCRPQDCRSYPHLSKEEFVSRLMEVVSNYEICPIVFNVYEQLKTELWHKNRRVGFERK